MKRKARWISSFILIASVIFIYDLICPVDIKNIHSLGKKYQWNSLVVVVENFPVTPAGRWWWWNKNHERLQKTLPSPQKPFTIMVVHSGEGYQNPQAADSDAFCFEDISAEEQCINKNFLMYIKKDKEGTISLINADWFYISETASFFLSYILVIFWFLFGILLLPITLAQAWSKRKSWTSLIYIMLSLFLAAPYALYIYNIFLDAYFNDSI